MSVLTGTDHIDILISETEIKARINHLAKEITHQFKDTEKLVVVGLLRGSFIFIADLVRCMNLPLSRFHHRLQHGDGWNQAGKVRILKDLETTIKDRDVLVVEDIIDTGHTLYQVMDILRTRQPASLKVCTLLNKPLKTRDRGRY